MKNYMYHFKHSDGSISFIGWNEEKKVYSVNYYANVGLLNAVESRLVKFREIKIFANNCRLLGYKQVEYLPGNEN